MTSAGLPLFSQPVFDGDTFDPWETLTPSCRDNYIARADAAIRFLGGAS